MEVMRDSFFEVNLLKFYRSIRNGLSYSKVSVKAGEACEVSHEQKEKPWAVGFLPFISAFKAAEDIWSWA